MRTPKQRKFAVIDLETTGLSIADGAVIFAYCIGYEDFTVDVSRYDRNKLQDFLNDISVEKIAHNFKFELSMLIGCGYQVPENTIWHDTMIIHQLLRNLHPSHSLDNIAEEYFPDYRINHNGVDYDPKEIDNLVSDQAKSRALRWDNVDIELMKIYQISDGQRTMLAFKLLYPVLVEKGMESDYRNEIELVKVTIDIENYGLMLHRREAKNLKHTLEDDFKNLAENVHKEYEEYLNLNSDIQLNNLLYKKLELPILDYTGKGKPSTGKDTIFKLLELYPDLKILKDIIKWRSLTNGISTIRSYLDLADENSIIHPTINTNRARTGRQSASNPNLQNVAKEKSMKNLFPIPARRCFRARPNRKLWTADYKGIELRLIIERSNCESMRQVVVDGGDPHVIATRIFYGITEDNRITIDNKVIQLTKDQFKIYRGSGKNAHFALPYGAQAPVIANTLNWPLDRTIQALREYESLYPEIYHFAHTMMKRVKKCGYVVTPFGRILRVPLDNIHSAADYDIQGTAAGILKRAQVRVHKFLKDELNNEVRMVLPVHDEIIYCAPDYPLWEKKKIVSEISKRMTYMPEIKIPLDTEWKESSTVWADAKEMILN